MVLDSAAGISARGFPRAAAVDVTILLGVAAAFAISAHAHGSYQVSAWGPLGLALVAGVVVLLVAGRLPSPRAWLPAGLLVAVGCWSVLSTAWGGLPDDAWRMLDRCVLAAAALLLGSQLATSGRRAEIVLGGVLAGATIEAVEVLVRLATGSAPKAWALLGPLDGPVGYKNGQAAVFAVAMPLAARLAAGHDRRLRPIAGASAGLLLGALLLTQSRGALIAVGVALVFQVWWTRSVGLVVVGAALAVDAVLLDVALARVERGALVSDASNRHVAVYLAGWCVLSLAVGYVASAAHRVGRIAGQAPAVTAVVAVFAIAGVAVAATHSDFARALSTPAASSDGSGLPAAGSTHLSSLSLNGRREAWRVAGGLISKHPLAGGGQSAFARAWTEDRQTAGLYIIQPHSLELELLGDLGVVGLALFAGFVVLLVRAVGRTRRRSRAAAGIGVLIVCLGQASFDWTWSFPALVAGALVVAGAVARPTAPASPPILLKALAVAAGLAVAALLAGPYLSQRQVASARTLQTRDAAAAQRRAREAARIDPWNASAHFLQGRLAEAAGQPRAAADDYRAAARYSRQPWVDYFNEARALRAAGAPAAAWQACVRAAHANPAEKLVLTGPCGYDVAGNDWPPVAAAAPAAGLVFRKDLGCARCVVGRAGAGVEASVPGGPDSSDTAYAVRTIVPDARGRNGVVVSGTLRLGTGDRLSGYLDVLEVRDAAGRAIFSFFIHPDGTLNVYSPTGGLQADPFSGETDVHVPGDRPLRFRVAARAGDAIELTVDGRRELAARLGAGATSSVPRTLRAGIVWYDSLRTHDVVHAVVAATAS